MGSEAVQVQKLNAYMIHLPILSFIIIIIIFMLQRTSGIHRYELDA